MVIPPPVISHDHVKVLNYICTPLVTDIYVFFISTPKTITKQDRRYSDPKARNGSKIKKN